MRARAGRGGDCEGCGGCEGCEGREGRAEQPQRLRPRDAPLERAGRGKEKRTSLEVVTGHRNRHASLRLLPALPRFVRKANDRRGFLHVCRCGEPVSLEKTNDIPSNAYKYLQGRCRELPLNMRKIFTLGVAELWSSCPGQCRGLLCRHSRPAGGAPVSPAAVSLPRQGVGRDELQGLSQP